MTLDYTLGDRVAADRRTDATQLDFATEAKRLTDEVLPALIAEGYPDPRPAVDAESETVSLCDGAIRAVGAWGVRSLADRFQSIALKRTTARLGHPGGS
jgi:hypothetical protein